MAFLLRHFYFCDHNF